MNAGRKMGLFVCILALVMALAGCSGNNGGNKSSPSSNKDLGSGETVTLEVGGDLANQAILEAPFKEINKRFMEKYPNIKLKYDFSHDLETLNVAMQAGALPEVFWVQGDKSAKMAEMARNGYLVALDDLVDIDLTRYPQSAIDYATVDGKLYSNPPSFMDYVIVYYNKDIFDKYHIEKPETWDEFVKAVQAFKEAGITPIASGGSTDYDRLWFMLLVSLVHSNNAMAAIEKGESFDLSELANAFDVYQQFIQKGYLGDNFAATSGSDAQLAFFNGQAAMAVDGTWNNNTFVDSGLNIGRFPIPGLDGKKYSHSGPSNMNTYAISNNAKNLDAAAKYISFLATQEAQQIIEDYNGPIPIVKDIKPKDTVTEEMADFDEIGKAMNHVFGKISTENSKPDDVLLTEVLPKLMTNEITGQQAAERILQEIERK